MDNHGKNFIDKPEIEKSEIEKSEIENPENSMMIIFIPDFEKLCFDLLYNQYIDMTDTDQLIENISIQNLEAFLYQTAKYFYEGKLLNRGKTK